MKLSEFIKLLKANLKEFGDHDVVVDKLYCTYNGCVPRITFMRDAIEKDELFYMID